MSKRTNNVTRHNHKLEDLWKWNRDISEHVFANANKSAQPVSLRKDCRLIRLTSLECPKVQDDVSFRMTPVIVSPPAAPCSASSWNKNETTDSPRGRWFSYAAGKLHVKALVDSAKPNFQIGIPKNISLWLQRATEKSVRFQTNLACIRII